MRRHLPLLALVVGFDAVLLYLNIRLGALDARLHTPASEIPRMLSALGAEGRRLYALTECADLVFIALYTLLLARLARSRVAFLPGAFDVVETAGILALLVRYPEAGAALPIAVSVATPLKWGALGLAAFRIVRYHGKP